MRGKGPQTCGWHAGSRIIPAHAGKSYACPHRRYTGRDHPRPCGEKARVYGNAEAHEGSPPPMRGKGLFHLMSPPHIRITPAHAGKSAGMKAPLLFVEDHPRPCGEKDATGLDADELLGSPPPMRGKAHPLGVPSSPRGSPPPMRGKALLRIFAVCIYRITPAHAGKRRAAR